MKKYIVEGIGTFFLMFVLVLVSNNSDYSTVTPLVMGLTLMSMIYEGEHLSGAHYNPAMTLALLMRGKMDRNDTFYYPIAQVTGVLLAAVLGGFLLRCGFATDTHMHVHKNVICSVLAEFIGTFAWIYVALNVSTLKNGSKNPNFALATGFTVAALMYAVGGISGGLFNPALALGAVVAGMSRLGDIGVYLAGDLLGAAAAATVYQLVCLEND
ncbi:MAG: aquaporin [Lewinellaceae bacterium]|nr:aquaporin [Lewinellaceae bacterium]